MSAAIPNPSRALVPRTVLAASKRAIAAPPTIKDIARDLGVAASTVTRALQGHPRISEAMRAKVAAAALAMGYVPDSTARTMRTKVSRLVGFIAPNVEDNDSAAIACAMADCCNRAGLQLVLAVSNDDPGQEAAHIRTLIGARAAGLIIVPTASPTDEARMLIRRLPYIQVIRRLAELDSDYIVFDDEHAIREATKHLIDTGHRRIAYLGSLARLSTGMHRVEGYRKAFKRAGIAVDERYIRTTAPDGMGVREALHDMLSTLAPTAIVAGGSRITVAMLQVIDALKLDVPRDLSVVGFGDHVWSNWWRDGLTTVCLPIQELASAAGSLLVRRVGEAAQGIAAGPARGTRFRPRLIPRSTTRSLKT